MILRTIFIILLSLFTFAGPQSYGQKQQRKKAERIYYPAFRVAHQNPDRYPIIISLDGRMYKDISRSIHIDKMTSGRHRLKVYRVNVKDNGKIKYKLIFEGTVNLRPEVLNVATVYNNGVLRMNYQDLDDNSYSVTRQERKPRTRIYKNPEILPEYKEEYNEESPEFNKFMIEMDQEEYETQKIQKLKAYLKKSNGITVSQVSAVNSSLSFESSRLEVIKLSKEYLLDPENKADLLDDFEMEEYRQQAQEVLQ